MSHHITILISESKTFFYLKQKIGYYSLTSVASRIFWGCNTLDPPDWKTSFMVSLILWKYSFILFVKKKILVRGNQTFLEKIYNIITLEMYILWDYCKADIIPKEKTKQ